MAKTSEDLGDTFHGFILHWLTRFSLPNLKPHFGT
ncbi:hypothetical protein COLO4_36129 [Corchorus olitorius]|uniref:Uncharacterized protein n=1 Tax=Corchorus olitorius TaxID=93759 RepID=A0A1R3GAX1_9ROSI|nr:hypothetical protein COLO4_36129 [Corchorus olitorius]